MAETLGSIVKEAKRNKYSLTKKLSQDGELLGWMTWSQWSCIIMHVCAWIMYVNADIVAIWEGASEFVERQMLQQKVSKVMLVL